MSAILGSPLAEAVPMPVLKLPAGSLVPLLVTGTTLEGSLLILQFPFLQWQEASHRGTDFFRPTPLL